MSSGRRAPFLAWAIVALLVPAHAFDDAPGPERAQRTVPPVLDYLKGIAGRAIVGGIHNREPNSRPDLQTNQLRDIIGRYPGIWSADFLFGDANTNSRWAMIYECKNQWDKGAIVHLMMHVAPPNQGEDCAWDGGILSHLSDQDWSQAAGL